MNGTPGGEQRNQAPASHYVIAAVFGAIVTIALSLAVGASNPEDFWVASGITGVCALYPSISLGVRLFVSNHTVTRDRHGDESVELAWMRQAAAGAFLDVLVTTIVISVVLMLSRAVIEVLPALLALIGLSAADVSLRYLVIRHRALR